MKVDRIKLTGERGYMSLGKTRMGRLGAKADEAVQVVTEDGKITIYAESTRLCLNCSKAILADKNLLPGLSICKTCFDKGAPLYGKN